MLEGFLLLNKPEHISSYGCIARIKRIIGKKQRIGHAGTLDPFATGLLIVAIGRNATRHLDKFMLLDKEYTARGKLGELTDTLDNTGVITKTYQTTSIAEQDMLAAIKQLGSSYEQTPPIYSAKKINGKRLYALARTGKKSLQELAHMAQQKTRLVELLALELINFDYPYFSIRAHVSHGTYVRSLVNDIAAQLNNCATTHTLKRTQIGPISCASAVDLDMLKTEQDIVSQLTYINVFLNRYITHI